MAGERRDPLAPPFADVETASPSEVTAAGVPYPKPPPRPPRLGTEDLEGLPPALPDDATSAAAGDTETIGGAVGVEGAHLLQSLPERNHLRDDGVIARGGFGAIHRAYDARLLRQVAMKVLEKDNPRAAGRFIEEGQITAQLSHPNIVPVYEAGTTPGQKSFFTMKLVRGLTLGKVVREAHQGTELQAALHPILEIFLKVCDAVSFAHSKGVLHRDLKPENIMVGSYGQVYLMDWGIAHVMGREDPDHDDDEPAVRLASPKPPDKDGTVVGTPSFMAPEQAQGKVGECDERTDVFALGAILYYILTGTPPHQGRNTREKLARAQACVIERPERRAPTIKLPPGLCQIAMKALHKAKGERYQSASALRLDLERFLRGGWWFETMTFAPGEIILREGEHAEGAFIIVGGTAEAFRGPESDPQVLSAMGPGDVFGEMAMFTDQRRTASVRATSPLSAMVITKESMDHQFGADSWVGLIVKTLARRFRELDERTRSRKAARRPSGPTVRPAMKGTPPAVRRAAVVRPVTTSEPVRDEVLSVEDAGAVPLFSPEDLGFEAEPARASGVLESSGVEHDPWASPANESFLDFGAIADELSESFGFGDGTLPQILLRLGAGDLDDASRLYEHSEGNLAASLLEEVELNPHLARPLAELFHKARDFPSAGRAFELCGDLRQAAAMYEAGDNHYAAAGCYRQVGDLEKAARAFEKGGDLDSALKAYEQSGARTGMADLLLREGRYREAAEIYREAGDVVREIEMLRLVPAYDPSRVEAALRLGELYTGSGHVEEAARLLTETLQTCEAAWSDNRVAVALIPLLLRLGRSDDAHRVMAWAKAQKEGGEVPSLAELSGRLPPAEAGDEVRTALRRADPEAYQTLKNIPLFAELSLVDMRDLYRMCEERPFDAGTVLIEAGRSPGGLFVLLEGEAEVRLESGELLSRLSAGEFLGEISLVTDGPATARAVTLQSGRALFLSKEGFDRFIYQHEAAALRVHRLFNRILAERMTVLSGVTARSR